MVSQQVYFYWLRLLVCKESINVYSSFLLLNRNPIFLERRSYRLFSGQLCDNFSQTRIPESASNSLTGAEGAETNRRSGRSSLRPHRPAGQHDSFSRNPKTT